MGEIATAFEAAFRDYLTDGIPSSGVYNPEKGAIRNLGGIIESAITDGGQEITDAPYASLAAAVAAAASAGKRLRVTGAHTVSSGATYTCDMLFDGLGAINPATGVTVTLRGIVQGPQRQIFGGAGHVVGLRYCHTAWWGAKHDFATDQSDDGIPINKAFRSVEASYDSAGGEMIVDNRWSGDSLIETPIYFSPTFGLAIQWRSGVQAGQGRLYTDVRGEPTFHVRPSGNTVPTNIAFYSIDGLHVSPFDGDPSDVIGLKVGDDADGFNLTGIIKNRIDNVDCEGCGVGIWIVDALEIIWRNVGSLMSIDADTTNLKITSTNFDVSEHDFWDVKFGCYDATKGKNIHFESNGAHGVAGTRFHSGAIYKGLSSVYARITSGTIGDIWWKEGVQFDGAIGTCFDLRATGTGIIDALHIRPQYINVINSNAIDIRASSGGKARKIDAPKNRFRNVSGAVGWFVGVTEVDVSGSNLQECGENAGAAALAAFYFEDGTQVCADAVSGYRNINHGYEHIAYFTGACDLYSALGITHAASTTRISEAGVTTVGPTRWLDTITPQLDASNTFATKQKITASLTGDMLFYLRNTHASGLSAMRFEDESGTYKGHIGYDNANDWVTLMAPGELVVVQGLVRTNIDNTYPWNSASFRPTQHFAVTATVGTSDAREKTALQPIPDGVKRAVRTIMRGVGFYQWLSAVQAKGADARLHVGVTAQAVYEAFANEGEDPVRWALFCADAIEEAYDVEVEVDVFDEAGVVIGTETRVAQRTRPRIDPATGKQYVRLGLRGEQLLYLAMAVLFDHLPA